MSPPDRIAAFIRYSSINQVVKAHDALYQALGSRFSLHVAGMPEEANEVDSLARYLGPGVVPMAGDDDEGMCASLNQLGLPIVILPTSDVRLVLGLTAALDLLAQQPSVLSVCGFTFDPTGPGAGAFTSALDAGGPSDLLVEIAQSDQHWSQFGRYAYTQCIGPGRLAVVRSGHFTRAMCAPLSAAGLALANMFTQKGETTRRSLLFSGFAAMTGPDPGRDAPLDDGVEILPEAAYASWLAAGVAQVSVLHTSFAIRDDHRHRIVHVGDRSVRAVDSKLITKTADPGVVLLSPAHARQLGPGFEHLAATMTSSDFGERPSEHWGSYELRALELAKRVDSVLPHSLREYARRRLRG